MEKDIRVGYAEIIQSRDNKTTLVYDECYTEIEAIEILMAVLQSRKKKLKRAKIQWRGLIKWKI